MIVPKFLWLHYFHLYIFLEINELKILKTGYQNPDFMAPALKMKKLFQ